MLATLNTLRLFPGYSLAICATANKNVERWFKLDVRAMTPKLRGIEI